MPEDLDNWSFAAYKQLLMKTFSSSSKYSWPFKKATFSTTERAD